MAYFGASYWKAKHFEADYFRAGTPDVPPPSTPTPAAPDYAVGKPKRRRYWFETSDGTRISAASVDELQRKLDSLPDDTDRTATVAAPPKRRRSLIVPADFEPLPALDDPLDDMLAGVAMPGAAVDLSALVEGARRKLAMKRRRAAAILLLHN